MEKVINLSYELHDLLLKSNEFLTLFLLIIIRQNITMIDIVSQNNL